MTTVGARSAEEVHGLLRRGDLVYPLGPLVVRVRADLRSFADAVHFLLADVAPLPADGSVADFTVHLERQGRARRWFIDGTAPREAFSPDLALPYFEWAIHDAVAEALAPALAVHGGVVRSPSGKTVALVGRSGSGKSTLVAGMVAAGWTLLSDEFVLLDDDGLVRPIPGLITLKGRSIGLFASRRHDLRAWPTIARSARRGPMQHLASPRVGDPAERHPLSALVFPTWQAGHAHTVTAMDRGDAILQLIADGHNDHVLGEAGFMGIAAMSRVPTHRMLFEDLDTAIASISMLVAS